MTQDINNLALFSGWIAVLFIGLLGLIVLMKIYSGKIDLSHLISEANGQASLSRFQFLIFTFVIAVSLVLLVINSLTGINPKFPEIPTGVWALLGISGGSYVVSKGIQKGK
ncbi:MAG: hypothetical protein ISR48_03435 [Alphaproteobacteria bacterium]|nr:hypothetical protein [Alphaproteobacteria bacterium]